MGECVGLWKNNACGDCTGEMNQAVGKGKGCRAKCSQDKAPKENKKDNKDCVTECGDKKEFKKRRHCHGRGPVRRQICINSLGLGGSSRRVCARGFALGPKRASSAVDRRLK